MAHSLSANKRVRQNSKRRTRNVVRKSALKTQARRLREALHDKDLDRARAEFLRMTKKLDQTAAKGTIHKNQASRRKSRLAKQLNALAKAAKS